jgi:hypothetical protein
MRIMLTLILLLVAVGLYAAPLSQSDHAIIMSIADAQGVPRSVADRLQIEESGDPKTNAWGDSEKIGPVGSDGAQCLGLYQLNPKILAWAIPKFYHHNPKYFNWRNPIDNAVIALGLAHWLHDNLGTWYLAACGFNTGIGNVWRGKVSDKTKAYALRVVNWPRYY